LIFPTRGRGNFAQNGFIGTQLCSNEPIFGVFHHAQVRYAAPLIFQVIIFKQFALFESLVGKSEYWRKEMTKKEGKIPAIPRIPFVLTAVIICFVLVFITLGCRISFNMGDSNSSSEGLSGSDVSAAPESSKPSNFEDAAVKSITAGEEIVINAEEARLSIPETALESGVSAAVHTSDLAPELEEVLTEAFEKQVSLYQVIADGENDGTGPAVITAPVDGKQAFLLEIIDGEYYSLTQLEAVDGKIAFQVPIGSVFTDEGDDSLQFGGSYQFTILPGAVKTGMLVPASSHLAKASQQADPRNCGLDSIVTQAGRVVMNFCRQNTKGTIKVNVPSAYGSNATMDNVDKIVDIIEQIMDSYSAKGFTAAQLEKSKSRVQVVVKSGSGDPYYSPSNSTVYIPDDSISKMDANLSWELAHELAHWVQDHSYNFTRAYWGKAFGTSPFRTWWLEVSAENMVFLFDQAALEHNLTYYGMTTVSTKNTPFQYSPNQWNDQLYNHAQLVKVFMCDDGSVCPISESGFVEAINRGAFPYEDEKAVKLVSDNLEDYAYYLLGKSSQNANTGIHLSGAVTGGSGYGEYIEPAFKGGVGEFKKSGYDPQMVTSGDAGSQIVNVNAVLQKSSVYPLLITSGINPDADKLPLQVKVFAGAPFYYRIGDGDVQYSDGGQDMILGLVHPDWGAQKIRIVAVAPEKEDTFKAEIRTVDFGGTWQLSRAEGTPASNISCDKKSRNWVAEYLATSAFPLVILMGDFSAGSSYNELIWSPNQERWDAYSARYDPTISTLDVLHSQGTALIAPGEVLLNMEYQEEESPPYKYDSGEGDAISWDQGVGSYILQASFKKVQFLFPQNPGDPAWKLTDGTANVNVSLTIVTMQFGPSGQLDFPKETYSCEGTITFDAEVTVTSSE
jgi:hypothetical protein